MRIPINKALKAGLTLRNVTAILDDVVTWDGLDTQVANAANSPRGIPLNQAREAELLTAWRRSQGQIADS